MPLERLAGRADRVLARELNLACMNERAARRDEHRRARGGDEHAEERAVRGRAEVVARFGGTFELALAVTRLDEAEAAGTERMQRVDVDGAVVASCALNRGDGVPVPLLEPFVRPDVEERGSLPVRGEPEAKRVVVRENAAADCVLSLGA